MKNYAKPTASFQTIELFEKIADTCWGYGSAWYIGTDIYGNPVSVYADWGNGCGGGLPPEFIAALVAANVDVSQFHNNVANTKSKDFIVPGNS